MLRFLRLLMAGLLIAATAVSAQSLLGGFRRDTPEPHSKSHQETGFLNRTLTLHGITYRFQVYLPESFRREKHKPWPVILFLHGRGERGAEGMWQTQVGLPQAVRGHPERWPFVIVMPQCPLPSFWTDPEMLAMAMAALDQETAEFRLDTERTYLTGLSLGGYGAWELGRLYPQRWAAMAVAAGGIFWSYAPERWKEASTLPAEYAQALGHTPIWLFHGSDDNIVALRQDELIFEAFKASGGHVRLWVFQGLKHDCWTRAYNEPELPRWLLLHHGGNQARPEMPQAERQFIPLHPAAIKLTAAQLDALCGEYHSTAGRSEISFFRQGDLFFTKNIYGEVHELAAESPTVFFYPNGASLDRMIFERNGAGRITAAVFRDDRHEERWEKRIPVSSR